MIENSIFTFEVSYKCFLL